MTTPDKTLQGLLTPTTPEPGQAPDSEPGQAPDYDDYITFTQFTSVTPLSKTFSLDGAGGIDKKTAAFMFEATAQRLRRRFSELPAYLDTLDANQAVAWGVCDQDRAEIRTQAQADPPHTISRTKTNFHWAAGAGVLLLDVDNCGMTPAQAVAAITAVCPELANAAYFIRPSLSAAVHVPGAEPGIPKSFHIYVWVANAADIPRAGAALFARQWLAGHGRIVLSGAGSMLLRSPVDAAVWQAERLDFVGKPLLGDGLEYTAPVCEYHPGGALDTASALPSLSPTDRTTFERLVNTAKGKKEPESIATNAAYAEKQADKAELSGKAREAFITTLHEARTGDSKLPPDFVLHCQGGGTTTAGDILANPAAWEGKRFGDPRDPAYGNDDRIAVFRGGKIYSHAHGGCTHTLLPKAPTAPDARIAKPHAVIIERFAGKLTYKKTLKTGEVKTVTVLATDAAVTIAGELLHELAHEPDTGTWLRYTGCHWQTQDSPAGVVKRVSSLIRVGTQPVGWSVGYRDDVVNVLTTEQLLPPPKPTRFLAFSNGLLDPDTLALTPATPETAPVGGFPHVWRDDAECTGVKQWLTQAVDDDADTVELLRAWLAALVRGVPLQQFLFLVGAGGTGKSTFAELATALVGAANTVSSDLAALEASRFETARLYGKRLAILGEVGKHGGGVNTLKSLTGGDALRLERKHQQSTGSFVFRGLVLLIGNEHMQTTDQTSGLERRRITVRFDRVLTEPEKLAWQARGGNEGCLHAEMPGLIRWLLAMPLADIQRRLAILPARTVAANLAAQTANSSVAAWLVDSCAYEPNMQLRIGVKVELRTRDGRTEYEHADIHAYPNYLRWCSQQARSAVSVRKFADTALDAAPRLGWKVERRLDSRTRQACLVGLRLTNAAHGGFALAGDAPEVFTNER